MAYSGVGGPKLKQTLEDASRVLKQSGNRDADDDDGPVYGNSQAEEAVLEVSKQNEAALETKAETKATEADALRDSLVARDQEVSRDHFGVSTRTPVLADNFWPLPPAPRFAPCLFQVAETRASIEELTRELALARRAAEAAKLEAEVSSSARAAAEAQAQKAADAAADGTEQSGMLRELVTSLREQLELVRAAHTDTREKLAEAGHSRAKRAK